jgi:hypothetical protein
VVYAVDETERTVSIIAFVDTEVIWSDEEKLQNITDTAYNNCIDFKSSYAGIDYASTAFGYVETAYEPSFADSENGWCLASEYEISQARIALGDDLLKEMMQDNYLYWLSSESDGTGEFSAKIFQNNVVNGYMNIGDYGKVEIAHGISISRTFHIDQP